MAGPGRRPPRLPNKIRLEAACRTAGHAAGRICGVGAAASRRQGRGIVDRLGLVAARRSMSAGGRLARLDVAGGTRVRQDADRRRMDPRLCRRPSGGADRAGRGVARSEEHTSELQSLMRISYAVFCLKKKKKIQITENNSKKHMYQQH